MDKWKIAWEIYGTLKSAGADIGDASVPIIFNVLDVYPDDPLRAAAPDLLALTDELLQVCDWFGSTVNSLRLGVTIDTHPDWNAVEYLESQAQGIRSRAADAIAGALR